jgi:large subunit ribosomal protein L1
MAKITKKAKLLNEKVDRETLYAVTEAVTLVKENATAKFDETIEVAFNLNLDPTKAEQQLRGALVLPHGSGKTSKILVFAEGEAAAAAEAAGADYVGADEFIQKIQKENWFDFDVVVATPQMMPKIGRIGQILGPKGIMPNPRTGTVTPDVAKAVEEIKAGKITYRIDKFGNIHAIIGKASFSIEQLEDNFNAIYNELVRIKPTTAKGVYMTNVAITSTMGVGVKIDTKSVAK